MANHAYERVAAGKSMPGVFIVHDRLPAGEAISEILLVIRCNEQTEWPGRILYLPL